MLCSLKVNGSIVDLQRVGSVAGGVETFSVQVLPSIPRSPTMSSWSQFSI